MPEIQASGNGRSRLYTGPGTHGRDSFFRSSASTPPPFQPLHPGIPPVPVCAAWHFAHIRHLAVFARAFIQVPADDVGMLIYIFFSFHVLVLPVFTCRIAIELLPDRSYVFQVTGAFPILPAIISVTTFAGIGVCTHVAHPVSRSGRSSSKVLAWSAFSRPCWAQRSSTASM